MNSFENYKINPKITKEELKSFGFEHDNYKTDLYKKLIQLVIHIDADHKWWSYQVHNTNSDFLYVPFYQRNYGVNELVDKLDKRIERVLQEMVMKNILIRNIKECA